MNWRSGLTGIYTVRYNKNRCRMTGGGCMLNCVIKLAVYMLRLLYIPYKAFLKPRDKICMLSRQGNENSISFVLTKNALLQLDSSVEVVILSKKIEGNLVQKFLYCFHILRQMYHIATSKIVIVDGYCIPVSVLKHKENQTFIQMWHALNVIKKFAYRALDKPAGVKSDLAEIMCMHKNYTHLLCGCQETGDLLRKSFRAPEAELVIMGLPYIDSILHRDEKIILEMYRKYPQLAEKEIILYAPTFRKYHKVKTSWIREKINLDKYNVVVKLHPVDQQGIDDLDDPRIIYDEMFTTHQWLWICDRIVTDYSGIGVESTLLDKKLYFYLYDKALYEQEIGLNINLYEEPIAPYVCETAEQLVERMEENYDFTLVKAYKNKYIKFDTNNCSAQFAKWLLKQLYVNSKETKNGK